MDIGKVITRYARAIRPDVAISTAYVATETRRMTGKRNVVVPELTSDVALKTQANKTETRRRQPDVEEDD